MPRYYRFGYQAPQYAGQWTNQLPTPQSQAPGLRYGLGATPTETLSAIASVSVDASKLSDADLSTAIASLAATQPLTPIGIAQLERFKKEKADRKRNRILLIGGAGALAVYFYTRKRR